MDIATFLSNYGLIILLAGLLVFMFWSSRRRMQKQKAEQEEKARQTVPGSEVLLQGGLYGTIVSYDAENLDQPAIVALAPGVEIKVHSQAILRVVNPATHAVSEDEYLAAEESHAQYAEGVANGDITSISDDHIASSGKEKTDPDTETGTKSQG